MLQNRCKKRNKKRTLGRAADGASLTGVISGAAAAGGALDVRVVRDEELAAASLACSELHYFFSKSVIRNTTNTYLPSPPIVLIPVAGGMPNYYGTLAHPLFFPYLCIDY